MKSISGQSFVMIVADRLRAWWRFAHRITTAFALRGSVAMLLPFLVLFELGQPFGAVFAALGGLHTVLADAGGAYRRRLGSMLLALLVSGLGLFIGGLLPAWAWLGAVVLALVAFPTGMARLFGGAGTFIGLFTNIMFLLGYYVSGSLLQSSQLTGFYAIGGVWSMIFLLLLWRLRPYRILLQQVAACYDACIALVATLQNEHAGAGQSRMRQLMRVRHKSLREAIRTAQATLDSVRVGSGHKSEFLDRLALLLAAVSREAVVVTSLRAVSQHEPGTQEARLWQDLFTRWREALAAVSRLLSSGRGEIPVAPMRAACAALEEQGVMPDTARAPLRLALLQLDAIAELGTCLDARHFAWAEALPRLAVSKLAVGLGRLVAQLNFRSIVFRHALRVAVAAGFGLWLADVLHMTHPLWLPMTILIVLQPEFGATWQKLGQRLGGTLGGILIAAALHFLVRGNVGELALIAIFIFGTLFFIRGNYGMGVVMLTPMILLLLGVLQTGESAELIVARAVDTLAGGVLALAAAWLLWPMWQRNAFLAQCAVALRAERDYLAIVFAPLDAGRLAHAGLMQSRHRAELESDNADAVLRRMLSEPKRKRGNVRAALGLTTTLHRFANNASQFAVALREKNLAATDRTQGDQILQRLDSVVDALEGKTKPQTLKTMQSPLETTATDGSLASWFERFAADIAMLAIAARRLLANS